MTWEMEVWQIWLLAGMILAALEMMGLAFVALALGVSCIAGALVAAAGGSLTLQIAGASLAAVILTPLFVRLFKHRGISADSISLAGEAGSTGQLGTLVEQQGRLGIVVKGDFFPAEADNDAPLEVDQSVIVLRYSGITAIVQPVTSPSSTLDQSS